MTDQLVIIVDRQKIKLICRSADHKSVKMESSMPKIVDVDQMKAKILDAAMLVYAEEGIHVATVSTIAARSGLGKGTIYLYFESKEALTVALVQRVFADLGAISMPDRTFETLDGFLQHLRDSMDLSDERAAIIPVFFEVFGPSFQSGEFMESVAAYFDRQGTYYADIIAGLQKIGQVAPDVKPEASGRALASMVDGMSLHKGLFDLPPRRYRAMINDAISIIGDGLRIR